MDQKHLTAGRFRNVEWVRQTGSTNADLLERALLEPEVSRVLITDEQTAGRGRLDRSWEMEPGGGLMISFFVPWTTSSNAHVVPIALGVALSVAIERSGRACALKWPNDIVVGSGVLQGKKLGGMLSSSVVVDGAFSGVVAGVGCNVSWPPLGCDQLPEACALQHLDGDPIDVETLARTLISGFDRELARLIENGPRQMLDRYRDRCATLGQLVRVEVSGKNVEGRATGIDDSGALLVEVDHQQRRIDVGDVIHLRPQEEQSEQSSE